MTTRVRYMREFKEQAVNMVEYTKNFVPYPFWGLQGPFMVSTKRGGFADCVKTV